jgi:hypothetical protein
MTKISGVLDQYHRPRVGMDWEGELSVTAGEHPSICARFAICYLCKIIGSVSSWYFAALGRCSQGNDSLSAKHDSQRWFAANSELSKKANCRNLTLLRGGRRRMLPAGRSEDGHGDDPGD